MADADISFCQGETVTVQGSIQHAGGGAYDITGYTVVWVLTASRGSPALLTKSTTAGTLTILNGVAGSIQWEITSAESNALPAAGYTHECHVRSPAPAKQYCAWHGKAIVTESTIGTI